MRGKNVSKISNGVTDKTRQTPANLLTSLSILISVPLVLAFPRWPIHAPPFGALPVEPCLTRGTRPSIALPHPSLVFRMQAPCAITSCILFQTNPPSHISDQNGRIALTSEALFFDLSRSTWTPNLTVMQLAVCRLQSTACAHAH